MTSPSAVTARVSELVGTPIDRLAPVGGGSFGRPYRAETEDGREFFVKVAPPGGEDLVQKEAEGLRWLAEAQPAGGAAVIPVVAAERGLLILPWVATGRPGRDAAERFGRALALTHEAGADRFGSTEDGYIASQPLPSGVGSTDWPSFYADARLRPFLERAMAARAISEQDGAAVRRVIDRIGDLAGPAEPPARLHGDLWSGNVLWTGEDAVLIDPSAHGGHRESDLAMLALFGLPYLEVVLESYWQTRPLADGWHERVSLHQLYPLLVHATLFGGQYGQAAGRAARAALRPLSI